MAIVVSTRCTYAPHEGLPELPGDKPVDIPDSLLHVALSLKGVVEVRPSPPPIPASAIPHPDELPVTAWESQSHQ